MDYCKACKIYVDDKCLAGYTQPTNDVDAAIKQALHKGEWPCTYSPHRAEFLARYRGDKRVWDILKGFKK